MWVYLGYAAGSLTMDPAIGTMHPITAKRLHSAPSTTRRDRNGRRSIKPPTVRRLVGAGCAPPRPRKTNHRITASAGTEGLVLKGRAYWQRSAVRMRIESRQGANPMNKSRMQKNAWSHVRLRPVAKRFYGADGPQLAPVMTIGRSRVSGTPASGYPTTIPATARSSRGTRFITSPRTRIAATATAS